MIKSFMNTIKRHGMIEKGDRIVVGVSGGPDSMALLSLLHDIKDEYSLEIFAVHLNHMNRGILSFHDMDYVSEYCKRNGIGHEIVVRDIVREAKKSGTCFEEAGRQARYDLFEEIRNKMGYTKIAVAHNINDQAETILFRLIRGSGIDGMRGMLPVRGNIIRPLLETYRSEIEAYCDERNLKPQIDETNSENVHDRNKIRLDLIPYIEKELNPSVIKTICSSAEIMVSDSDYMNKSADEAFVRIFSYGGDDAFSCSIDDFDSLHFAMKSRIVRMIAVRIGSGTKDITAKHVTEALRVISSRRHGVRVTVGGVSFGIEYSRLVARSEAAHAQAVASDGDALDEYEIDIEVSDISRYRDLRKNIGNDEILIDYDKICGGLFVRSRKNGDAFRPLGMSGTKKLKSFMVDQKIPSDQRAKIPILCDGNGIVWVYGYRQSEDYRIDEGTSKVARIRLAKVVR